MQSIPRCIILTLSLLCCSFHKAVADQPQGNWFPSETLKMAVCGGLFGLGQLFVLSSFYRLGVTGTFLGDYCGIFMSERVTGFPFNVVENPMYVGSTMSFLAYSLWYSSWAGLLIAATVAVVYVVALKFEGSTDTQRSHCACNSGKRDGVLTLLIAVCLRAQSLHHADLPRARCGSLAQGKEGAVNAAAAASSVRPFLACITVRAARLSLPLTPRLSHQPLLLRLPHFGLPCVWSRSSVLAPTNSIFNIYEFNASSRHADTASIAHSQKQLKVACDRGMLPAGLSANRAGQASAAAAATSTAHRYRYSSS